MKLQLPFTVAVSFALRFAVCWAARGSREAAPARAEEPPHILAKTFHVQRIEHKGRPAAITRFAPTPSRSGIAARSCPQPEDGQAVQIWTISFDGGRTWVYAEEVE